MEEEDKGGRLSLQAKQRGHPRTLGRWNRGTTHANTGYSPTRQLGGCPDGVVLHNEQTGGSIWVAQHFIGLDDGGCGWR